MENVSKTAIAQIVQFATGLLVLFGFGHEAAAELATELGMKLESLYGLLIAIWAGITGTMNKIRKGEMQKGLGGYLFKNNGE